MFRSFFELLGKHVVNIYMYFSIYTYFAGEKNLLCLARERFYFKIENKILLICIWFFIDHCRRFCVLSFPFKAKAKKFDRILLISQIFKTLKKYFN